MVTWELSAWKKAFTPDLGDVRHLKDADKGEGNRVIKYVVDGPFKNLSINGLRVPVCHCFAEWVVILISTVQPIGYWVKPAIVFQFIVRLFDLFILGLNECCHV